MKNLSDAKHFHLMGIGGGAGMSALATLMLEKGKLVSGCDLELTNVTQRLKKEGAQIYLGHDPEHLKKGDVLVYSPAVPQEQIEIMRGKELDLPILLRSELLRKMTDDKKGISVSGSHGKTTTSAMIAVLLESAGLKPSIAIGGDVLDLGSNARWGQGNYFVFEADESDGSFNQFSPDYFVLTNLDNDHLDFYQSFSKLLHYFETYLNERSESQWAFVCNDDPFIKKWLKERSPQRCLSFGLTEEADCYAKNIRIDGWKTKFELVFQKKVLGSITFNLPGKHNLLNAMAASSVALHLGVPIEVCQKSFLSLKGVQRRFELKGKERDVTVVDDYAHHPTEIAAALATARTLTKQKVICVFQPHRFTRTRDLGPFFPPALSKADEVVLTDIYPASESPIDGIDGELLFKESQKAGYSNFTYVREMDQIPDLLVSKVNEGDLVLTVGAGNIHQVGESLIERLKNG